jgi:hypothetical protein
VSNVASDYELSIRNYRFGVAHLFSFCPVSCVSKLATLDTQDTGQKLERWATRTPSKTGMVNHEHARKRSSDLYLTGCCLFLNLSLFPIYIYCNFYVCDFPLYFSFLYHRHYIYRTWQYVWVTQTLQSIVIFKQNHCLNNMIQFVNYLRYHETYVIILFSHHNLR